MQLLSGKKVISIKQSNCMKFAISWTMADRPWFSKDCYDTEIFINIKGKPGMVK